MKSPLFVSAIELFAHATELYSEKNDRKYKFVILHLANSIELILKDKLVSKGKSIYNDKRPHLTIGIWDSFNKLQELDIAIPEKPIIELLIDDRNSIQHRFGFPNEETVYFYLKSIKDFFVRFLRDEYATVLSDELEPYLDEDNIVLLEIDKTKVGHLQKLKKLSPAMAILQSSDDIEKTIFNITKPFYKTLEVKTSYGGILVRPAIQHLELLLYALLDAKIINAERLKLLKNKYQSFNSTRNMIAHGKLDKLNNDSIELTFNHGLELLDEITFGVKKKIFTIQRLRKVSQIDQAK